MQSLLITYRSRKKLARIARSASEQHWHYSQFIFPNILSLFHPNTSDMKKIMLFLLCSVAALSLFAQKDTVQLSGKEAQDILRQLKIDTAAFLSSSGHNACGCIDSVRKVVDGNAGKLKAIAACIDEEVTSYALSLRMMAQMTGRDTSRTISLPAKGSYSYKKYYYEIERWLKDSCKILNNIIAENDTEREKSYSTNEAAMKAYDAGVELIRVKNYKDALPFFEKAISIDPEFAFALDNLGMCHRQLGNYEKAIEYYTRSLKVDPLGHMPLQNLPVVYVLQKKYEAAIAAYNNLLNTHPNDPEAYYGIALVYFSNLKDDEKALGYMCKAYNIYVEQQSPYRSDAEKVIGMIYQQMKKANKEETFMRILKENNIRTN
jgi:tetratricopeptide (TPR) repeat protein